MKIANSRLCEFVFRVGSGGCSIQLGFSSPPTNPRIAFDQCESSSFVLNSLPGWWLGLYAVFCGEEWGSGVQGAVLVCRRQAARCCQCHLAPWSAGPSLLHIGLHGSPSAALQSSARRWLGSLPCSKNQSVSSSMKPTLRPVVASFTTANARNAWGRQTGRSSK